MKILSKVLILLACSVPLITFAQGASAPKAGSSTTQAPGNPEGGPLGTRSTATVDDAKAAHKARKAKSGKPKETAPGDVVANPPPSRAAAASGPK